MLSFNPYCWSALHITCTPTFGEFIHTDFPTTCWAMIMCELTIAVSHPHRRRTCGSRGATQRGVWSDLVGVSQLTYWRQRWILVRFIFIFYFVRLPLCNKYSDDIVTFISIHSVIICVVFFGACMRCTRLCSLNPGVTCLLSLALLSYLHFSTNLCYKLLVKCRIFWDKDSILLQYTRLGFIPLQSILWVE
jgi:hypothetical protein